VSVGVDPVALSSTYFAFHWCGSKQDFDDKVGQAISLAGLLTQTVDHLVTAFFDKHKRAILEERHEKIEIPDFLNAVREAVKGV
jgi:hypothetical protein